MSELNLCIDSESVNIYIDKGDDVEPIQIVYWHEDEWLEDAETVVPAMLNAIDLFHRDPYQLFVLLGQLRYWEDSFDESRFG